MDKRPDDFVSYVEWREKAAEEKRNKKKQRSSNPDALSVKQETEQEKPSTTSGVETKQTEKSAVGYSNGAAPSWADGIVQENESDDNAQENDFKTISLDDDTDTSSDDKQDPEDDDDDFIIKFDD